MVSQAIIHNIHPVDTLRVMDEINPSLIISSAYRAVLTSDDLISYLLEKSV